MPAALCMDPGCGVTEMISRCWPRLLNGRETNGVQETGLHSLRRAAPIVASRQKIMTIVSSALAELPARLQRQHRRLRSPGGAA